MEYKPAGMADFAMLRKASTRMRVFPNGAKVDVIGYRAVGIVRYSGPHKTNPKKKFVYGVELSKPIGKNNGTIGGEQYFKCKAKHGVLVAKSKVKDPGTVDHGPEPEPDVYIADEAIPENDFDGDPFGDDDFADDSWTEESGDAVRDDAVPHDPALDSFAEAGPAADSNADVDTEFGGFDD